MGTVEIRGYDRETRILSFTDWEAYAMPPEGKLKHWKEGRSAFELARIWTSNGAPDIPSELAELLNSHEATRGSVIRSGITEHETTLPFANRGPRCHDLALKADQGDSGVTVCIEAKADETFGGTVEVELLNARNRTPKTKFPDRLDWLTRSLLGLRAFDGDNGIVLSDLISGLPYQLFSAISGTLLEAELQKSTKAVLVVHEFRTALTTDAKMEANGSILDHFLRLFLARNRAPCENFCLRRGQLFGPVSILERSLPGTRQMPCDIPFFIGKIRTDRMAS